MKRNRKVSSNKRIITLVLLGVAWGCQQRETLNSVDQLYLEASTGAGSSDAALSAARRLGAQPDARVDDLLVRLALQGAKAGDDRLAVEAVRQAQKRGAQDAAAELVVLLSPKTAVSLRLAVAEALAIVDCPKVCVQGVLRYLERIWEQETNVEQERALAVAERRGGVDETGAEIFAAVGKQEERVYSILYAVLRQRPKETVEALVASYGRRRACDSPLSGRTA